MLSLWHLESYVKNRATAYISFNKCEPKEKEIIAVSAAAGAVGNLIGQLAKQKVQLYLIIR